VQRGHPELFTQGHLGHFCLFRCPSKPSPFSSKMPTLRDLEASVDRQSIDSWSTEASRSRRDGTINWKGRVSRGPWRGRNHDGCSNFLWTPRSDPYPHAALAMGVVCAKVRIWFLTAVQNLECSIQCLKKIGVLKFWEEELLDCRHAIHLCGGSVSWTVWAEILTSYRQKNLDNRAHVY